MGNYPLPIDGLQNMIQAVIHFIGSQELPLDKYDVELATKVDEKFIVYPHLGLQIPSGMELISEVVAWEEMPTKSESLEVYLRDRFRVKLKEDKNESSRVNKDLSSN
jgi:hypothetical protein